MDDLTHHQKISKAIREDDFDELQTLLSAPQTKKVDLANILASALQSDRRRAAKEVYNQFKRQSRLSLIVDWAQNKEETGSFDPTPSVGVASQRREWYTFAHE